MANKSKYLCKNHQHWKDGVAYDINLNCWVCFVCKEKAVLVPEVVYSQVLK